MFCNFALLIKIPLQRSIYISETFLSKRCTMTKSRLRQWRKIKKNYLMLTLIELLQVTKLPWWIVLRNIVRTSRALKIAWFLIIESVFKSNWATTHQNTLKSQIQKLLLREDKTTNFVTVDRVVICWIQKMRALSNLFSPGNPRDLSTESPFFHEWIYYFPPTRRRDCQPNQGHHSTTTLTKKKTKFPWNSLSGKVTLLSRNPPKLNWILSRSLLW